MVKFEVETSFMAMASIFIFGVGLPVGGSFLICALNVVVTGSPRAENTLVSVYAHAVVLCLARSSHQ